MVRWRLFLLFGDEERVDCGAVRALSWTPLVNQAAGFLGTFAPFLRASESPMAMACSRLLTTPPFPPLPDFSVPRFSRCNAFSTHLPAAAPYLRFLDFDREVFVLAGMSTSSFLTRENLAKSHGRCGGLGLTPFRFSRTLGGGNGKNPPAPHHSSTDYHREEKSGHREDSGYSVGGQRGVHSGTDKRH